MNVKEIRIEYHIYSSDLGGYKAMGITTREEAQMKLEQLQAESPEESFRLVPVEKTVD
jgi:hypothetical protein